MDQTLSKRLGFLHDAAHALFASHPSLSRHYLSTFTETCVATQTPIIDKVARRYCSRCATLYAAGRTVDVCVRRVHGRQEKGKGKSSEAGRGVKGEAPAPGKEKVTPEGGTPGVEQKKKGKRLQKQKRLGTADMGRAETRKSETGKTAQWTAETYETATSGLTPVNINRLGDETTSARQSTAPLASSYIAYVCTTCTAETRLAGTPAGFTLPKPVSTSLPIKIAKPKSKTSLSTAAFATSATTPKVAASLSRNASKSASSNAAESSKSVAQAQLPKPADPNSKAATKRKRKDDLQSLLAKKGSGGSGSGSLSLTDFLSDL
ncbi:uncharacterized protein EV422DRAFT_427673 [Fimicolochytrium jonesii]|uniref:uncharacterized protein n=1 Tax=Fimicolochytrium jonesii TaxID=1396493 RepID=UPI0022FE74D5|nr:uncharacterized protein EV422DRAFT_427673 [Fimicolochytrium jonesii]KAI8821677.1 hypothetical protein EV422DRAFT_427673 [Fimicolochytrium jonesii]